MSSLVSQLDDSLEAVLREIPRRLHAVRRHGTEAARTETGVMAAEVPRRWVDDLGDDEVAMLVVGDSLVRPKPRYTVHLDTQASLVRLH